MMTLYLRNEQTRDDVLRKYAPYHLKDKQDVVAYLNPQCTKPAGYWAWWASSKPTRRNKYVTFNCYRYNVVWVP